MMSISAAEQQETGSRRAKPKPQTTSFTAPANAFLPRAIGAAAGCSAALRVEEGR
jgi:hypothetical protein